MHSSIATLLDRDGQAPSLPIAPPTFRQTLGKSDLTVCKPDLGGLILAGGGSTRMRRDKAALEIDGVRAVDLTARLATTLGAKVVMTSGPNDYGYPRVADDTPFGGPVGGIIAGAAALSRRGCEAVLVLAVDAPTLTPDDVAPLFGPVGGAAFLGFPLPFVAPLLSLPRQAEAGWSIAHLLDLWGVERIAAPPSAVERLKGANTPGEFAHLVQATAVSDVAER